MNAVTVDRPYVESLLVTRDPEAHKGVYGHALLVCGSKRMPGAALLAAGGALRSGCGLVTVHTPSQCTQALVSAIPSAMFSPEPAEFFSVRPAGMERYRAVGVGCGIGTEQATAAALAELMEESRERGIRLVIDADALNILSSDRALRRLVPEGSVLTPHPGELRRLAGRELSPQELPEAGRRLAEELASIVVLKGHRTRIYLPDGTERINTTGNAGMAKGGSGDVLTGLLTGLLARGYDPAAGAVIAVYAHGAAGDEAARALGEEGMCSADLIKTIPVVLRRLYGR